MTLFQKFLHLIGLGQPKKVEEPQLTEFELLLLLKALAQYEGSGDTSITESVKCPPIEEKLFEMLLIANKDYSL